MARGVRTPSMSESWGSSFRAADPGGAQAQRLSFPRTLRGARWGPGVVQRGFEFGGPPAGTNIYGSPEGGGMIVDLRIPPRWAPSTPRRHRTFGRLAPGPSSPDRPSAVTARWCRLGPDRDSARTSSPRAARGSGPARSRPAPRSDGSVRSSGCGPAPSRARWRCRRARRRCR